MKKFNGLCVILVVLFVLCLSNASANLLTNGSFEDPDIATLQVGGPIEGWSQWAGTFFLMDEAFQGGQAQDGTQWIQTDMGAPVSTNLAQVMILTPGVTYTVSFYYTGNAGQAGTEGVLIRTFDMVDGTPANIIDHAYTYAGENSFAAPDWQYEEFNMTVADGASMTALNILGQSWGAPEGAYMWIDNVQVVQVSAVPEPATIVMLSIGSFLLTKVRTKGRN